MKIRRAGLVLLAISTAINGLQLFNPVLGDLSLYQEIGEKALQGQPLYGAHPFEYPPYVVVWYLLPALRTLTTGRESAFIKPFGAELLLIDFGIKWLLLVEGLKAHRGWRAYLPFGIFAATGIALQYIFFKRFDLIPAGMTVFSVACLASGWPLVSGVLLAAGIGTKLYPVVLTPLLFVVAWRQGELRRWLSGFGLGLMPLLLLAAFMPWWRFTQAHQTRGLQVESLYAGFIWLAHRMGGRALWVATPTGTNVGGAWAEWILVRGKVLWVAASVASMLAAAWKARNRRFGMAELSRLALLPLTAFIAFNFVLSPQYMIWLAGLVALAAVARWDWPIVLLTGAVLLGPFIYPTPSYEWGYDLPHVLVLCLRNTLLVVAWGGLVMEAVGSPAREQRGQLAADVAH